jgi:hypothetical protein
MTKSFLKLLLSNRRTNKKTMSFYFLRLKNFVFKSEPLFPPDAEKSAGKRLVSALQFPASEP